MNDTDRFPLYEFVYGKILPLREKCFKPGWQYHHYIEKKMLKKYPDLIKYQKLILIPCDMNYDIDSRTNNFKKRWGIELEEVVWKKERET